MNMDAPQTFTLSHWESQRAWSKDVFQSLQARETPDKRLKIYQFNCKDKDPRGSGVGLAYAFVRTGNSPMAIISRWFQSLGFIE